MQRTRKTVFAALVLTLGFAQAVAAQKEPFADMDNNGVYGEGDVLIGKLINNDGQFSTDKAEGGYRPQQGPVGIVVPTRFAAKKRVVVLKASGNIIVNGDIAAGGLGGVIYLLSTGGSVHVADGVRFSTDSILQLIGLGDVTVGNDVQLRSKSNDFSMVSIASESGDVSVGEGVDVSAKGLVEVVTGQTNGGGVSVGRGSRLLSGGGDARVTAHAELAMEGVKLQGRQVVLGSHGSARTTGRAAGAMGPGYAEVRNCEIKVGSGLGSLHIFANGGDGSTIDISKTKMNVKKKENVTLDADVIVR